MGTYLECKVQNRKYVQANRLFTAVHFGEIVGQVPMCFEFFITLLHLQNRKEDLKYSWPLLKNRACFLNKEPTKDLSLQK